MIRSISHIAETVKSALTSRRGPRSRINCSYDAWNQRAQSGEFRFHQRNTWRPSEAFARQTASLFSFFGLKQDAYAERTVIDIGAGSKLRSRYFQGAELIAIEPLADRFRTEIEWCDLDDAAEVYAEPAERFVETCKGRGDLVISINVLDHCFDFPEIIRNLKRYTRPEGRLFLSFDKHEKADDMHPLQLDEQICGEIFSESGLEVESFTTGFGDSMDGLQTYGHGPYAMNYWLRHAA